MTTRSITPALAGAASLLATGVFAQQISSPDPRVFPESVTSDNSGAIIFGSLGSGGIYRAAPGQTADEPDPPRRSP